MKKHRSVERLAQLFQSNPVMKKLKRPLWVMLMLPMILVAAYYTDYWMYPLIMLILLAIRIFLMKTTKSSNVDLRDQEIAITDACIEAVVAICFGKDWINSL